MTIHIECIAVELPDKCERWCSQSYAVKRWDDGELAMMGCNEVYNFEMLGAVVRNLVYSMDKQRMREEL